MEIIFDKVNTNKVINLNLKITSDNITGIYNDSIILDIIKNHNITGGRILIAGKEYKKYDHKQIAIIDNNDEFFTATVYDEILFNAKIRNYKDHHIMDKIVNLFDELELDKKILKKVCHTLSNTEKYLVKVVANLVFDPQIIIFKNIMSSVDHHYYKIIKNLLIHLKDNKKIVIVTSLDSNILYDITDEVIIFGKKELIISGPTFDTYTENIEILLDHNIDVPYFPLLTYQAKQKKNINLFYRRDVRDVIKDVYKSVS